MSITNVGRWNSQKKTVVTSAARIGPWRSRSRANRKPVKPTSSVTLYSTIMMASVSRNEVGSSPTLIV